MKQTPFTKYHIEAGAKMAEFAGYNMPIDFTGINDEHIAVRQNVGVFDVSHMGEIWILGEHATELLQRITTNNVAALTDGKVQYSAMPNGRGGIVDDILVYRFSDQRYMLCVNASNIAKDYAHILEQGTAFGMVEGVDIIDRSEQTAQLAIQGPAALAMVEKICSEPIQDMVYYTFKECEVGGCPAILSTTGYTGSGGCEIYVENEYADKLWAAVWAVGAEHNLKNIGLGARDTLRLEMGFCLYGNDIDDTTSPIEAGLGWITKFVDNKPFIDRELMECQKSEGTSRRLVGIKMVGRGIPRHGYAIADTEGREIGCVTSGTMSPMLKVGVATGYVESAFAKVGTRINVVVRERLIEAEVVKLPFI